MLAHHQCVTSVLWFRRDLRLHDLPALVAALEYGPVAPLFVIDRNLILGRWPSSNRTAFMLACLRELDAELRERGNQLNFRVGRPDVEVLKFAREVGAAGVFVSRDYTPFACTRDAAVKRDLEASGISLHARRGTLVQEPEDILSDAREPYSVFSAFFRRWQQQPMPEQSFLPDHIPAPNAVRSGVLPTLQELGIPLPAASFIKPG